VSIMGLQSAFFVGFFARKRLKLILEIRNSEETGKSGLVSKACKYLYNLTFCLILFFKVDVNSHVLRKKEISYRAIFIKNHDTLLANDN
jgi:hypothetical protein